MKTYRLILLLIFSLLLSCNSSGEQCGKQANNTLCPHDLCCSKGGYCGNTDVYCGDGCQSQCPTPYPPPSPVGPSPGPSPSPDSDLSDIITEVQFDTMFPLENDDRCFDKGFFTYDAFITAAKSFPGFGTTGDHTTRKKEIAAFFGQTSHETTGWWPGAPGGEYIWGYCIKENLNPSKDYCEPSITWPCAANKSYYERGPMMMKWNYNYGKCGEAIGADLLSDPDHVAHDAVISFKTAIWYWMTRQSPTPSCHDVASGQWEPSEEDVDAGRLPGYGVITNIINGPEECGRGSNDEGKDRMGFYKTFCDILGVDPGENLDCYNQRPFGAASFLLDAAI